MDENVIDNILLDIKNKSRCEMLDENHFNNYREQYVIYRETIVYLINQHIILKPLEKTNKFILLPKGEIILKDAGWKKHNEKEDLKEQQLYEKQSIDLKITKLQYKTFWWVFCFGLFGGLYSSYDFIKNLTTEEDYQSMQKPIIKKESEQPKSHTLSLVQKNQDSLPDSKKRNTP